LETKITKIFPQTWFNGDLPWYKPKNNQLNKSKYIATLPFWTPKQTPPGNPIFFVGGPFTSLQKVFAILTPAKTNGWIPKMMGLGKGGLF